MNTNKKTVRILEDLKFYSNVKYSTPRVVMLMIESHRFLTTIAFCLLLIQPLVAQEGIKGNLVSVTWLEKNLKNVDIMLLDASPSHIYAAKHIPGAINYDIFTYGVQELPVAEIEKSYRSWGNRITGNKRNYTGCE